MLQDMISTQRMSHVWCVVVRWFILEFGGVYSGNRWRIQVLRVWRGGRSSTATSTWYLSLWVGKERMKFLRWRFGRLFIGMFVLDIRISLFFWVLSVVRQYVEEDVFAVISRLCDMDCIYDIVTTFLNWTHFRFHQKRFPVAQRDFKGQDHRWTIDLCIKHSHTGIERDRNIAY